VRSETCSISMPLTARTASTMRVRCASLEARTVTSRIFFPCSTRTRSIAPSSPPASPIAFARLAKAPGWLSRWTRSVALNDDEGCGAVALTCTASDHCPVKRHRCAHRTPFRLFRAVSTLQCKDFRPPYFEAGQIRGSHDDVRSAEGDDPSRR
jgi:hypothetical protein